ncbi:phosphatase PAP2 family protein [Clostridium sp. OS1-26]|uniref:phosphatase PAP2 family protein n=1 Tax=Clostridium sp. OS1-26 TaxID=3070681 RepID=UPI0027E0A796|nr:phosphatase PAP2 family protein [Clostridium sp. OS1-26]WML33975.1 phosphatase PAP2 family protein [Clostridium sp. OS1-26]
MAETNSNKASKTTYISKEKSVLFVYFVAALSLVLLVTCLEVVGDSIKSGHGLWDAKAINYVYSIRNAYLSKIFIIITSTGNPLTVTVITVVISSFLYFFQRKREAVFYIVNILGVWVLNESIKAIVRRARPSVVKLVYASGYSFPSGHSMVFMTCSLILAFFILNYAKNKLFAYASSIFIIMYGVMVGLSRIYLGVHYLSDVLAGWTFAAVWTLTSVIIYIKISVKEEINFNVDNINNNYMESER